MGTVPEKQPEGEDIKPQPGFVVKTHDDTGRKVFINVCGDKKIPAPGNWKEGKVPDEVKNALEELAAQEEEGGGEAAEALRFPLSCGDLRNDFDKKNEPCSVVDVILNAEVVTQSMGLRRLKVFVVELAIAWVGQKHKLELDQKYKLPHLKYKGRDGPQSQRIRIDPKCLISEIDEPEDNEVSFPLVTRPIPQTAKLPPEGLKAAAAAASATSTVPTPSSTISPTAPLSSTGKSEETVPKLGGFSFGSMQPKLHHKIFYEGTPASMVVIEVDVLSRTKIEDVQVAVAQETVEIEVAGCQALHIQLPFAVSTAESGAALELRSDTSEDVVLRLRLPYKPYEALVEEARAKAPHSFGALNLSNAAFMDLGS
eukprot:CAMPEP_0118938580 /NCGR_PEP_ID=MMETSP1169-20130426/26410_1 /TAXON_ID=36882 /ORGANISM="Pyramimonas obovata, Strain CCMP722" /LENGTH=368 /DNA_ID=CAMNT_0006882555 /DNA_START=36 /DNA_END=1140 /DNA_ORIENTATION=-